ncbi:CCR4-NOT transcription complex subunit 10 [Condylostylus longicornis]|uniref:CCR4-NOT transcription complex subunit 10 n=1 Tax=Condylostylus longicornis TaxID=2530218 RepID=UPI00244E2B1D|nr:CCR4-NOT transcription complex subunit 10 [Condylostylus longicornis]XP_055380992.1 CCR4-NOT transcription complex subunit 10 [Condylostylus longicornis]
MAEAEWDKNSNELELDLLTNVQKEFNKKNYEACLKILDQQGSGNQISEFKNHHNKAIVKFYMSNCKDYKNLLEFLVEHVAKFKGSSNEAKYSISTACYNMAVIYYQLRKPYAALEILNTIVNKIEDLDESIGCRIGLLMLSLLLQVNQVKKAVSFLKVLEKQLKICIENFTVEEYSSVDDVNGTDRMFRLMSLLTSIVNQNFVNVPEDGSAEFAVLKAHSYYVGKDFQMAAKQLSKKFTASWCPTINHGENEDTVISNNMGVIHLRVRHYAIAARFFQNAIQFDLKMSENWKNLSLHNMGASKMPEIMYNLGISMLHLQRPKDAFDCFLIPLKIYYKNPRLWLRVAESCIMFYEKNNTEIDKNRIVSSVIGTGIHRKYVLEPSPKIKFSEDGQSSAIPNPNLEFAALCLRNAVSLVESYKHKFITSENLDGMESDRVWNEVNDNNFCSPSIPVNKEAFDNLRAAIYAASSYVSIKLGDFVIALEYAKTLLELENLSDAYTMLGNLYCAESLVMLNRLVEARVHLEPKIVKNSNYFDFETRLWQLNSLEAAQAVIKYNLVVILVLQGEFDVAKAFLTTFTHPVVMNKVKLLKMYIEVATGKF